MNANLPIVRYLSKPASEKYYSYSVGSVMIVSACCNIVIGVICTKLGGGTIASCFEWTPMLRSSHLSVMSAVLVVLKFQVLIYLSATLATMLEQMKLITLAIAARCVFHKKYSSVQGMSLLTLLLAMVQYAAEDVEESGVSANLTLGFSMQLSFVLISTLSTILREFKFKGGSTGEAKEAFPVQQVRIAVPSLLVAILFFLNLDGVMTFHKFGIQNPKYLFAGWTDMTWAVIAVMLACDWLSNYIQKLLDSVVVQILGCLTIPVVYAENIYFRPKSVAFDATQCISLAMVVVVASSFAVSTRYTSKFRRLKQKQRQS